MSDDDLVAALSQSVKKEVVDRYLTERRILEEEINLLNEDVCSLHGGHCKWEFLTESLAGALFEPAIAQSYFILAGLPPLSHQPAPPRGQAKPGGLGLCARYERLIDSLYQAVFQEAGNLAEERVRAIKLWEEVNRDIKHFEDSHDILALTSYLRSLDLNALQRQKLLGANFSWNEKEGLAAALAFRPVPRDQLALPDKLELARPERLREMTQSMVKEACRRNRGQIPDLWSKA